jgi:hypothetical protein
MSNKKNKNNFQNPLAQKFQDPNRIETMSEEEIFKIMDKDLETLLKQLAANLNGEPGAKYPVYGANMFFNPSSARYIYEYTRQYQDEIESDENELLAIRHLIATGYKDNLQKKFHYQDDDIRSDLLLKAFKKISKDRIEIAKKLKINSEDKETKLEAAIAIAIFSYLNMDQITKVATMIDKSDVKNKKKQKIFKKLYGKRYKMAYGALFTINRQNDFVTYMFKKFEKLNKKKKYQVLFEYATHYKRIKHRSFVLESEEFLKENKKLIKQLAKEDIGFKKAFMSYKKEKPNTSKDKYRPKA